MKKNLMKRMYTAMAVVVTMMFTLAVTAKADVIININGDNNSIIVYGGTGNGTESGTGNGNESGTGNGTESGNGNGTESGTGNGTENGTGNGTESGTGNGTESGTGNGTESGTGNGTESGTGNGTESGTGNGTESGTGNGTESGTGNGTESGTGNGTESGTGTGTNNNTSSIPQNAKEVNVWSQGERRASGYLVDDEVYLASFDDVKKVFPTETKTWNSVSVTGATPLYMWTDSFGYTYQVEANNVFLFQNGVKDTSGELVVAKPLGVFVDGKRVSGITVYLSDEDATVYAGVAELKKIFSANADKIACSKVEHMTVNYWATQFGYDMTIEDSFYVMLTKKAETSNNSNSSKNSSSSKTTKKTTSSKKQSNETTKKPYVSKKYKVLVENSTVDVTAKSKLVKDKEKIYISKKQANKILKYYKKQKIKKAIDIKSLAKKCGVKCKVKGNYVFFNRKANSPTQIILNDKILETKSNIINQKGKVFISSKIAKKLGVYVVNTAKSKKNKKKKLLISVNSLKNFGYKVKKEKVNGVTTITISR